MSKYLIPNLDNACRVVDLISHSAEGCSLAEISAQLNIPHTTTLRIVRTLLDRHFLAKSDNNTYTAGPALVHVGVMALDRLDIRSFARPVLQKLSKTTGESSHIAILNGKKSLLVEVCDSPHPVRIASRPGTLVDLHCSSTGKVFLAFCVPDPAIFCDTLELSPHTPNTSSTVEAVLADIKQTRKQGYAIDEEEYVFGARCLAAPIQNAFGKTIAAIGITASARTFTKPKIPKVSQLLRNAAAEISTAMGFDHD